MLRELFISCLISSTCFAQTGDAIQLRFLGEARLPTGTKVQGLEIGGVSGIDFDKERNCYLAVSDHYVDDNNPAIVYKLTIDLQDGKLTSRDVHFGQVIPFFNQKNQIFDPDGVDTESIVILKSGSFWISSEGSSDGIIPPFVRKFSPDGQFQAELPIPEKFLPRPERDFGIRENFGFEAMALTPDERYLFAANEEALVQDGPESDSDNSSPVRIIKYDLAKARPQAEFLYMVEPVFAKPRQADGMMVNGLVELAAFDENHLLALERAYVTGRGNSVRIYQLSLASSTDIQKQARLDNMDLSLVEAAEKQLVLDLNVLGVSLDNLEGMTFGPGLPSGERTLILVSDNNFSASQTTQFLAFAIQSQPPPDSLAIGAIQGEAHISPFVGQVVNGVSGVITHIPRRRNNQGFWMQSVEDDGNPATSEAIFVATGDASPPVKPGYFVAVDGQVAEVGFPDALTVTQINATKVSVMKQAQSLPEPVLIGKGGRLAPEQNVDDDSLQVFDAKNDAIDFYESVEGMRVEIRNAVVVGPLTRFGEFVVLPDAGENDVPRTRNGGILLGEDNSNPTRVLIRAERDQNRQSFTVGDELAGSVTGVLEYDFGNYKIAATELLPNVKNVSHQRETTSLQAKADYLTFATFNAENLAASDDSAKFEALALAIVANLRSPDLLALQEVQDDNGREDDGTVDAAKTLARLAEVIVAAGGPKYDFTQINPENNKDGGQPGGNIRVAFLYQPDRLHFLSKGDAGAADSVQVVSQNNEVSLTLNPGRVTPGDSAFADTRKSLVAEFSFNGHKLFFINNHLSSKLGDDGIFGRNQPPQLASEHNRKLQAQAVQGFVRKILSFDQNANVIVLGDMNEHEFRPALRLLTDSTLTDLIEAVPQEERYTYVYTGNSQVLDHVLVSVHLQSQSTPEVDIVHINADFPFDDRASDHDPVVVRLHLPARK